MTTRPSVLLRITAGIILTAVIISAACFGCFFAEETDDSVFPAYPLTNTMRVYCDELLICRGYYYNETPWFSFQDLYTYFFKECDSSADDDLILFTNDADTIMEIHIKDRYLIVNGRYLYLPEGYHTDSTGRLYFSSDIISRIFGFSPVVSDSLERADLNSSEFRFIENGETFYSSLASVDDLFWLPKIINAEAGLSSLEGQIAVGNVVMNRVADNRFPNNIKDVIFDTEHGRQFQPVDTGTISYAADELALAASMLALEGYNTAQDSLFFVESWTDHSWLSEDCFVCQFGSHLFYRG